MSVIEIVFQGEARLWFKCRNFYCNNNFKDEFMVEFYEIPIQVAVKIKCANRKFIDQKGSLQTYYYSQLKDANYILPRMQEYEKNYIFSNFLFGSKRLSRPPILIIRM